MGPLLPAESLHSLATNLPHVVAPGLPQGHPHHPASGPAVSVTGTAGPGTLPHPHVAACAATRATATGPAHLHKSAVPASQAGAVRGSRLRMHSCPPISLRDERLVRG
jgi:hypothetical protein